MSGQQTVVDSIAGKEAPESVWDLFRRWGYLQADLDPLGDFRPVAVVADLEVTGSEADAARRVYCGSIGVEFMHIPDAEKRAWVQERMEAAKPAPVNRARVLELLVRGEIFEQTLQTRYLGTKRFSLEGETSLLPLLDAILNGAAEHGTEKAMLAMSHRGRLNVMAHIVGRDPAEIFARFEDVDPRSTLGSGDVKYHMGATGEFRTASGRAVDIHLVSNPSHLEAVDPVLIGRTRAKQMRRREHGVNGVLAIAMHGDAAFAGQGIVAETLNMAGLPGYTVGGSIHIIVNNLIGFTTAPYDSCTTRYASDLAKRLPIPIFHVNSGDPEAVVRVGQMALEYRYAFGAPVVVDLIGYRRHGHSEVDDPTITQPRRYRKIEAHAPTWQLYAGKAGIDATPIVERARGELKAAQERSLELEKSPMMRRLPKYWGAYRGGRYDASLEVDTAVSADALAKH